MKLDGIKHIGIIGTGMIGASLAVLFTGNGYKTTMYAVNDPVSRQKSGMTRTLQTCRKKDWSPKAR